MNRLVDLRAAPTQTIEILTTGPGLAHLGPALLTHDFVEQAGMPPDLQGLLSLSQNEVAALPAPDVVQLFELAINEGFFGSIGAARAVARSSTRYERASSTRVWILEMIDTPPRALRVLVGLLDGLDAEAVTLRTTDAREANDFDVEASGWPESPVACPFRVVLDDLDTLGDAGTLCVRLEAERAFTEDEMARVDRYFEIWTNMLLMGGYLEHPLSGAPPISLDPGGWEDERTWVQEFEVFRCVPEAVHPVLHFTSRLAQTSPVSQLKIHA